MDTSQKIMKHVMLLQKTNHGTNYRNNIPIFSNKLYTVFQFSEVIMPSMFI